MYTPDDQANPRYIMIFLDLANKRSSVRGYTPDPIDETILRTFSKPAGSHLPPRTNSPGISS